MSFEQITLLDPKMDFIFKKLMENPVLLLDFLKSVLSKTEGEIISAEILNPITKKEFLKDKFSILDVKVKTADGRIINVEIQKKDEKNMSKRTLFHWSKMYGEEIVEGEDYRRLPKTICINILDFNYLETEENFHNIYRLLNTHSKRELKESTIEIHFIELKKYQGDSSKDESDGLKAWVEFLNEPELSFSKRNPTIKTAIETLRHLSCDKETQELYKLRKDALDEGKRQLNSKFSEGVEEGVRLSIKAVLDVFTDEEISERFNCHIESVREIRKGNNN
ncbi:MAG: Rpn family recombination-promoting nuclease/putative transposase [Turicibacter sp.]|nr:Rpn family recombination-promoting nuclease/putative transposase [Turicibacter sp.]